MDNKKFNKGATQATLQICQIGFSKKAVADAYIHSTLKIYN